MKTVLFKVKPDKLETWQEWAATLKTRESEVLETLKEENCTRELGVLFTVGYEHYVYMAMEFDGPELPSNQDVELNRQHRAKLKECLEPVAKGEVLYDFRRKNED